MTNQSGGDDGNSDGVSDGGSADDVPAGTAADDATILVVDDEASVVETFRLALEGEGHDVVTAENGGEALVEFDQEVDVVLLDRRMPGMSGDEVVDHLQEWRADCRVVMVTAVAPDDDIVDMSFDEYMTKPVSRSELIETVDQLLLFDRYEELLSEYHSLTRKYATLKAASDDESAENAIERVVDRRDAVCDALETTISEFSDDAVVDMLQEAHGDLP